jgi:hypothetical protein
MLILITIILWQFQQQSRRGRELLLPLRKNRKLSQNLDKAESYFTQVCRYMAAFVNTLVQVSSTVKSMQFSSLLKGTRKDIKLAKEIVPIHSVMKFLGLPMHRNQRCCSVLSKRTKGHTSLSIYRNTNYGYCQYKPTCGRAGDVRDLWLILNPLIKLPHLQWDVCSAALDLLARYERGEFDLSAILSGSSTRRGRKRKRVSAGTSLESEITLNHRQFDDAHAKGMKTIVPLLFVYLGLSRCFVRRYCVPSSLMMVMSGSGKRLIGGRCIGGTLG